jgi:hypothetical protein
VGSNPTPSATVIIRRENMTFVAGIIIGAFVGWNLPQPSWAKAVQDKITDMITRR